MDDNTDSALIPAVEAGVEVKKKKKRGKPTRPDVVKAAERRAFVIKLRGEGHKYREIYDLTVAHFGKEKLPEGYSFRRCYKDVMTELEKFRTSIQEDLDTIVHLEMQRLDAMLAGIWERAEKGNTAAIDTVLKIMARRSKLLGLDKPIKHAQTDPTGEVAMPKNVIIVTEYLEQSKNEIINLPIEDGDNGSPSE